MYQHSDRRSDVTQFLQRIVHGLCSIVVIGGLEEQLPNDVCGIQLRFLFAFGIEAVRLRVQHFGNGMDLNSGGVER